MTPEHAPPQIIATVHDDASLAEAALDRWDSRSAITVAKVALDRLGPDQRSASRAALLAVLAQAYSRTGEWERARDAAQAGLAVDSTRPELWRALGHALAALDCLEEAVDAFDQARAHTSLDDLITRLEILGERYRYAVQLVRRKKLDLEAEMLQRTPRDSALLTSRFNLLVGMHRDGEALDVARILTALPAPTLERAIAWWLMRARVAMRLDAQSSEGLAAVQETMRLAPNDPAIQCVCAAIVAPPAAEDRVLQELVELGFEMRTLPTGEALLPALCTVPGGACLIGSDLEHDSEAFPDELPQRGIVLPRFEISRYPVTVAEYARFVAAGQYPPLNWQKQLRYPTLPVCNVSWFDATAYCDWLGRATGERWRLPTEAEWEKTARWDAQQGHARIYPWGDAFDGRRCNTWSSGISNPTPIGSYPGDDSPSGAHDMAGNVCEWTISVYDPYVLSVEAGDATGPALLADRVMRGGSWNQEPRLARAACRGHCLPLELAGHIGFRVARDSISS